MIPEISQYIDLPVGRAAAAVDGLACPALLLDLGGKVLLANSKALVLFGDIAVGSLFGRFAYGSSLSAVAEHGMTVERVCLPGGCTAFAAAVRCEGGFILAFHGETGETAASLFSGTLPGSGYDTIFPSPGDTAALLRNERCASVLRLLGMPCGFDERACFNASPLLREVGAAYKRTAGFALRAECPESFPAWGSERDLILAATELVSAVSMCGGAVGTAVYCEGSALCFSAGCVSEIAPAAAESLSRLLPPKKGLFAAEYDVTLAFYLVRLAADANLWELSAHFDGRVFSAEITLARSARALPLIAREPDIRGLESAVERRVGILPAKGEK